MRLYDVRARETIIQPALHETQVLGSEVRGHSKILDTIEGTKVASDFITDHSNKSRDNSCFENVYKFKPWESR